MRIKERSLLLLLLLNLSAGLNFKCGGSKMAPHTFPLFLLQFTKWQLAKNPGSQQTLELFTIEI